MATFLCDHCGHQRLTRDTNVGRLAKCPECNHRSRINGTPPPVSPVRTESIPFVEPEPDWPVGPGSPEQLPRCAIILMLITWISVGLAALLSLMYFVWIWSRVEDGLQGAAVGAAFVVMAAPLAVGYVLARCIEKAVKIFVRR